MPRNLYSPVMQGFVQTQYVDQVGTAYPGQLWSVSDNTLVDSTNVAYDLATADGLMPGRAYKYQVSTDPARTGIDQYEIIDTALAAGDITAYDFAILVRNEQMHSNSLGFPCGFAGDLVNILRPTHFGRIWVQLQNTGTAAAPVYPTIAVGDAVNIIAADGTFSNAGGLAWAAAKFISTDKDGIAAIEFRVA